MKIHVFDSTGKKLEDLVLKKDAFGTKEIKLELLRQAIHVYMQNLHQHTSKVKSRGEVCGSTRKIWRQKGTGRARHGDRYAPLFVGGGVAHGPKGTKPTSAILPKKMKRKALSSALLLKLQEKSLAVLDGIDKLKPKTRFAATLLHKVANYPQTKVLIITDRRYPNLYLSTKNLQQVTLKRASLVNAYDVVQHQYLLTTKKALEDLQTRTKKA